MNLFCCVVYKYM